LGELGDDPSERLFDDSKLTTCDKGGWDPDATTFRTAAIGMEGREADLPDEPLPADFVYRDETPVLFGHYWMQGLPYVLHPHATCLDFSVANDGFLTAYRWSGESELRSANLVWVRA
jgi:hypothetical protein